MEGGDERRQGTEIDNESEKQRNRFWVPHRRAWNEQAQASTGRRYRDRFDNEGNSKIRIFSIFAALQYVSTADRWIISDSIACCS